MSEVEVERLVVRAPGLSPEEARRLERALAVGEADAASGDPVDELARRVLTGIADAVRRQL